MDLSEGCEHPVQVGGMCAICGAVVEDESGDSRNASSQLHDISGIKVNTAEASRIDSESTRHLLSHRKLALIVDLDQTIIHATVDPTVGEWMKDTSNPNFRALKDVGKFRLGTDGKGVMGDEVNNCSHQDHNDADKDRQARQELQQEGCWYYVKPRPGLQQFLTELAEKYEMYVYTMGTRSYAECVCKLVDPQGHIFGARILSRDENGSLLQKSLKKLFPMDTSMVVIIDDRADVWKWSPNLLKVVPFDFFVGIGDINASFLPAAPTVPTPTTEGQTDQEEGEEQPDESRTSNEAKTADTSKESKAAADEAEASKDKEEEANAVAQKSQQSAVSEQLGSRPLAKMQEALNVKNDQHSPSHTPHAVAVLRDDDRELQRLQKILNEVHLRWYEEWDARPSQEDKPAITGIIGALKAAVLADVSLVFSSVIPLQQYPESSDLWRLANEFGAKCRSEMADSTTHVVAAKPDTQKVIMGLKRKLPVVWPAWLHDSCARWARQPEKWYELPKSTATASQPSESESGALSFESDSLVFSSSNDSEHTPMIRGVVEEKEEEDDDGDEGEEEDDQEGFGEMNWDEANDEVDAALNGLTDDEDTTDDGYASDASTVNGRKRTLSDKSANDGREGAEEEGEEGGVEGSIEDLSRLSKRRKIAESRSGQSRLKNVLPLDDGESTGTSTPPPTKRIKTVQRGVDPEYEDPKRPFDSAEDEVDDDFLQSLQDELELQMSGGNEDEEDIEGDKEGLASDDE
ncbi:hypothetical protein CBS101457_000307 [Exobasidium rhododendri]|nr:hypothetical protein CBS101457_000307 [Exobasidium rhododendri]